MQTRPARSGELAPVVPGFELGECIGRGATSEVWAGASEADGRRVAVKVVHADRAELDAAAREASLSAVAASAHVVRVEACLPLEDGRVALVMPFLQGGSLGALVGARGHLEPGEVVTVLAPVASALARLHGVGVVHGDVSPGNVLLDVDGRPHLADLGLGHVVGEVSPGVWGSDGFVAPEVVLGGEATPAADVYSLGALGWLCLTGAVPGAPGLRPSLVEVSLAAPSPALTALIGALDLAIGPEATERPDADALAWALFEAATPAPIHLVRGGDEVSAITHRLRTAAGEGRDAVEPGGDPRTRVRWRPRRLGRGAVLLASLAGLLLAAMAVVVSGPGSGVAGGQPTPPMAGSSADPVADAPEVHSDDPRLAADAPVVRPRDLLTALAGQRAAAWRAGSPALLRGVDVPGSTSWARDVAAVTELERSGIRYDDLVHTVARVSTESATAERAVLRARIDTSEYVVSSRSTSTPRPASTGAAVLVDLVRTQDGWRISDIRDAG